MCIRDRSTLEVVPPPLVKTHPDHQVSWQGTGVVAKGVPADREIQFFGFPEYQGQGEEEASGEENGVDYSDYSYDEEEGMQDVKDEEDKEQEGTSSGGMSNLEKALLATEVAMVGKKLHGFVRGKKDGSVTEDQNTCLLYTSPSPRD